MAESLSHKFGQIIGDLLELAIQPYLEKFARENNLFLDKKGVRKTRKGVKLSWVDGNENKHDLDFVLERGGTDDQLGSPVAFIEIAWRRYTKHSRNKAQEIQGAILPLAEKYKNSSPFKGAVLAGMFTQGALTQLESNGFTILYFTYENVIKAFEKYGIDASFNEKTTEEEFRGKIEKWDSISNKGDVAKELLNLHKQEMENFLRLLTASVSRFVQSVIVIPLHGQQSNLTNILEAISFISNYSEIDKVLPVIKYEVMVKYNNGDLVNGSFHEKDGAIKFLEIYK